MYLFPPKMSDFYKVSHRSQYPKDTEIIYSNLTARSSRLDGVSHVVFFGLQYFVLEYLIGQFNKNFFWLSRPEFDRELASYKRRLDFALGGDNDVSHWRDLYNLGYLPLEIKALPEGTLVPLRVPLLTVRNTKNEFFWLGQWMETLLSNVIWHPLTTATIAHQYRKLLNEYAEQTSDESGFVSFQGHDFSMRGHTSVDSSCAAGAGHLLSFCGTDTIGAIDFLESYYGASTQYDLVGSSVAATEHSVMTVNGESGEFETFRRLLTETYPSGIVSIVSDSYDLWRVLTEYLPRLKNEILSRDGKVVVRPDCYDEITQILTPEGWKYFKYLNEEDEVAQVNDNGTYEFIKPLKLIKQYYNGPMVHFKDHHGKLDLLVTPNHRMVYEQNHKTKVSEAQNIKVGIWGKNFIRSARAVDRGCSLDAFSRLRIAFQADGSYCTGTNKKIRFSFSKERKINRLKDILNDCKLEYKIYPLKDGRVEFNIWCNSELVNKDFDWVDTNDLCSNWCCEFIEELSHWDSNIRGDGRIKFDTTNPKVIDKVELIALSAGYGVLISVYEDDRKEIFSDVYTANILLDNKIGGQSQTKSQEYYSGNVYCVQVPSGKVLVKRNRCTLVSGNSGDPVKIICGDHGCGCDGCYPISNEQRSGVIQLLWDTFGGTTNNKGYKELNPKVGAIYGDSITLDRCKAICEGLRSNGFASTNMVFGIGSYTYQHVTRDTFGLAFKATAIKRAGAWHSMFKNPITDNGMKRSAKGLLAVIPDVYTQELILHEDVSEDMESSAWNCLRPVFVDGQLVRTTTLNEIRERLSREL